MVAIRFVAIAAVLILALTGSPAQAVRPDEILSDATLEARARALSAELRCLVCQNQSIDDSEAPLARDLRVVLRERLTAGDSDAAVKSYLVARYGDFVLLKPPLRLDTLFLWLSPLAVLILGAAAVAAAARRRSRSPDAPLSEAEKAALAAAMERDSALPGVD
jgi:cytochrome c-type biogenesis protein CcmH